MVESVKNLLPKGYVSGFLNHSWLGGLVGVCENMGVL